MSDAHASDEQTADPDAAFEQVAETAQVYEAQLMALRLRAADIDAQVLDQSFQQEPLPGVRSFAVVRVLVPASDAARARAVLAEPEGDDEAGEPDASG